MTTKQMTSWLTTPLGERHFPIVISDGITLGNHAVRPISPRGSVVMPLLQRPIRGPSGRIRSA